MQDTTVKNTTLYFMRKIQALLMFTLQQPTYIRSELPHICYVSMGFQTMPTVLRVPKIMTTTNLTGGQSSGKYGDFSLDKQQPTVLYTSNSRFPYQNNFSCFL